jgi:hypothetical protein
MVAFYTLHVHRKDDSRQRHIMQGELPKVGDTVPATLAGERVSAKVGAVTDPTRYLRRHGGLGIEVHAERSLPADHFSAAYHSRHRAFEPLKDQALQLIVSKIVKLSRPAAAQNGSATVTSRSIESAHRGASYFALGRAGRHPIPDTPPPGIET